MWEIVIWLYLLEKSDGDFFHSWCIKTALGSVQGYRLSMVFICFGLKGNMGKGDLFTLLSADGKEGPMMNGNITVWMKYTV